MRFFFVPQKPDFILRSAPQVRVSKDATTRMQFFDGRSTRHIDVRRAARHRAV